MVKISILLPKMIIASIHIIKLNAKKKLMAGTMIQKKMAVG